jgi:hypothetical protein
MHSKILIIRAVQRRHLIRFDLIRLRQPFASSGIAKTREIMLEDADDRRAVVQQSHLIRCHQIRLRQPLLIPGCQDVGNMRELFWSLACSCLISDDMLFPR